MVVWNVIVFVMFIVELLPLDSWLPMGAAGILEKAASGWRKAEMWTLMYRGAIGAGALGLAVFVVWRVVASRRERERLEQLVASRTRQLRQSEELFRSIFEHATEGIYQSSLDGHNLRANPAMALLCGYASPQQMREELTDVSTLFYVQPGRRTEINETIARDGVVHDFESEIRRRDGSTLWIAESAQTVTNPANGATVYQGSIVDITARREMQAAQEQARAAAEAANRAKSAFLARMTHELRTPLTGILGGARVALRDPATDGKNRERYTLIADSGEHLLRLIDEVLDHSRIEAGRTEWRPGPFNLADLLRGIAGDFRLRAAEARLDFRCEADPALPLFVHGDAGRLRQVLDNLLGNAFKFTDRGEVTLTVRRQGYPAGDGGPGRVRFVVADTGIGIPAAHRDAIFHPFQQIVASGRPMLPGVGLGLNICARLVELMGGRLELDSAPVQGSRFFFDIPLPDADGGETLHDDVAGQAVTSLPTVGVSPDDVTVPSPDEIETLAALSLTGDIVRLRQSAWQIAEANPACEAFARELERLAAGFRMDAIGEFLRVAADRARSGPGEVDGGEGPP